MKSLEVPSHFQPERTGEVWKVEYAEIERAASDWRSSHGISPADADDYKIGLLLVDVQNTFCIPGFELFVHGRSGSSAVDDNRRLCSFIYRNVNRITRIVASQDTHQLFQIFHPTFLVDDEGRNPAPYTMISKQDVENGEWKVNPLACAQLGIDSDRAQRHIHHYARALEEGGRFAWTIWPFHALEGSIGHSLVSAVEEAVFFHSIVRNTQPDLHTKGDHPLTESYSIFGPEVRTDPDGNLIAPWNDSLVAELSTFDVLLVAGQAKSHCVAWSVQDLLDGYGPASEDLASRIYLLEDCTSPVVVPGLVDFSEDAAGAFERFVQRGAHVVRSTDPMTDWPGIKI